MWIESLSCLILLFQMSAPPAGYTVPLTYLDVQAERLRVSPADCLYVQMYIVQFVFNV
jgi:hypothetical protein